MEKFRQLDVWNEARRLVVLVYQLTKKFPPEERYCLIQQMRRAVISVVANIAEGSKRKSVKDRSHFFVMADTSLEEIKCYFIVSLDLEYCSRSEAESLTEQARKVGRMLSGLIRAVSQESTLRPRD